MANVELEIQLRVNRIRELLAQLDGESELGGSRLRRWCIAGEVAYHADIIRRRCAVTADADPEMP